MDTNNKTVEELNELLYKKNDNVTFKQPHSDNKAAFGKKNVSEAAFH